MLLLWQPFLRGEHRISAAQGLVIGLARGRRDALGQLVAARILGGGARGPGRRQGVPAPGALAASLLSGGAGLSARAARDPDPPGNLPEQGNLHGNPQRGGIRPAGAAVRARADAGRARVARSAAGDRFFLQRVPDAGARRGDPGQLHVHDAGPRAVPGGAHQHRVPDRGHDLRPGPRLEPAHRLRRPERVLLALPVFDRAAGREMALLPRRAVADGVAAGAISRRRRRGPGAPALDRRRRLGRGRPARRNRRAHRARSALRETPNWN